MAVDLPPKDVCPVCDRRGRERIDLPDYRGDPFNHPWRCSHCGAVSRLCEFRRLTAPEREEAAERKLRKAREYKEAHHDFCRRLSAEWSATHRAQTRRRDRDRYRESEEFRAERKANAKRWSDENPERRKEISARYYERHRHEIAFRRKRKLLDELREGKRCDSAT